MGELVHAGRQLGRPVACVAIMILSIGGADAFYSTTFNHNRAPANTIRPSSVICNWNVNDALTPSQPMPTRGGRNNQENLSTSILQMSKSPTECSDASSTSNGSFTTSVALFLVAFMYWYLMVFGALADSAGLPVPSWLPLAPGWPPSDADLAPALEDSAHFFYIQDALDSLFSGQSVVSSPPTVRLAVFNLAEAWVFSFLPALTADARRLPLPVVLVTWIGALGLTNAFLAPYLAFRELFASLEEDAGDRELGLAVTETEFDAEKMDVKGRNAFLSILFGVIASSVVAYAGVSCAADSTWQEWADFGRLAAEDRTYLAFCVDLFLFSLFQPFLLRRICEQEQQPISGTYNVPFIGLVAWLLGV